MTRQVGNVDVVKSRWSACANSARLSSNRVNNDVPTSDGG
jgi:hypothetical protein